MMSKRVPIQTRSALILLSTMNTDVLSHLHENKLKNEIANSQDNKRLNQWQHEAKMNP